MANKIKKYFWKRSLNNEIGGNNRKKAAVNFDEAKYISLIYNASNEKEHHKVIEFGRKLQQEGKSVRAIGFVAYKRLPHYCNPTLTWDFFTLKELNWYKRPDSVHIRDFLKVKSDILIYLEQDECLPLLYIAGLANAKIKVAPYAEDYKDFFDLMMDFKNKVNIEKLIEQIVYYLKMINKSNQ